MEWIVAILGYVSPPLSFIVGRPSRDAAESRDSQGMPKHWSANADALLRPCYAIPLILWVPISGVIVCQWLTQDPNSSDAMQIIDMFKFIGWSGSAVWLFSRIPIWIVGTIAPDRGDNVSRCGRQSRQPNAD